MTKKMECTLPSCKGHDFDPFCEAYANGNADSICWNRAVLHKPFGSDPHGTFVCAKHKED